MLVLKKMSSARRSFLLVASGLVILVTLFLLYDRFFSTQGPAGGLVDQSIEIGKFPQVNTDFNQDFIGKKPYTSLQRNGRLPVRAGITGRSNPFAEIPFSLIGE